MYQKPQPYEVWFLRYRLRGTKFFIVLCHFLPFYPPNNTESQNFEKNGKSIRRCHCAAKITIIWCMLLEIWSATEIVFCHFGPSWTLVYHKWQSYDLLFLRYQEQHNFLSFQIIFCPITPCPPNNLKNQNFGKMKKRPGNIIILQLCTTNGDHTMYGSWDTECDGQNFLSFWTIYCPFIPLNVSWDMERDRRTFLSFWTIFCSFTLPLPFLPPYKLENLDFEKMKKAPGDIAILHKSTQQSWSYAILFLRYGVWQIYFLFLILVFFVLIHPEQP